MRSMLARCPLWLLLGLAPVRALAQPPAGSLPAAPDTPAQGSEKTAAGKAKSPEKSGAKPATPAKQANKPEPSRAEAAKPPSPPEAAPSEPSATNKPAADV